MLDVYWESLLISSCLCGTFPGNLTSHRVCPKGGHGHGLISIPRTRYCWWFRLKIRYWCEVWVMSMPAFDTAHVIIWKENSTLRSQRFLLLWSRILPSTSTGLCRHKFFNLFVSVCSLIIHRWALHFRWQLYALIFDAFKPGLSQYESCVLS